MNPQDDSPTPSKPEPRPVVVHRGDVLFTLAAEIQTAARDLARFAAFERRVVAAAQSPSEWLLLRTELGGGE